MIAVSCFVLLTALAGAPTDAPHQPRRIDVKAFEWQVATDPVILGETGAVTLTITAVLPDGKPLDVAPPIVRASTGAVSAPVREAPGRWAITFTPPKERFPHVAIITAQVDQATGSTIGFYALPLWGKGRLEVKTKPESEVIVFIGNRSFGPVSASKRGVAHVDILAPPGPERAVAKSVDLAGNESQKTVDLGVPPFNRVALVEVDEVAAADGTGEAQLLSFAVDKKGEPLFDAPLEVKASIGGFEGAPLALAPGVYRLRYRPGMAPKGEATITARLEGSKASKARATVRLLSGPAVSAVLEPSTKAVRADGDTTVVVSARWFDQAGNTVPREAARVDVSVGRIDRIDPIDDEGVRVAWVLPARVSDERPRLFARRTTGEELGSVEVELFPGEPYALSLDPIAPVVADGQSSTLVVARVSDRVGNTLLPEGLAVSSSTGQVLGPSPDGGRLVAQLIPEVSDQEGFGSVVASLGELRAEGPVRILPRPRARLLVGTGLGASWNYGALLAAGPELSFLVRLPGTGGGAHAGFSLGYLVAVPGELELDDGRKLSRQHSAVPLHLEVGWRPLLATDWSAHLGGAFGLALSDLTLADDDGTLQRSIAMAPSAQLVAGIAYRLGPGLVEADLRAGWAQPLASDLAGSPLGVGLVLTYRFGI